MGERQTDLLLSLPFPLPRAHAHMIKHTRLKDATERHHLRAHSKNQTSPSAHAMFPVLPAPPAACRVLPPSSQRPLLVPARTRYVYMFKCIYACSLTKTSFPLSQRPPWCLLESGMRTYAHTHVYLLSSKNAYTHVHVCMYVRTYVCMNIRMYEHTYV